MPSQISGAPGKTESFESSQFLIISYIPKGIVTGLKIELFESQTIAILISVIGSQAYGVESSPSIKPFTVIVFCHRKSLEHLDKWYRQNHVQSP